LTPLPASLGGSEFVAWRLDKANFSGTWDSGEGARRFGGRWSSRGVPAIYCAIDPATAILEVAVHTGFKALDTVPHVLMSVTVTDPTRIHIVYPVDIPNPNWLHAGTPSTGQQRFGEALLAQFGFIVVPSVVSTDSWNLIFANAPANGAYALRSQEPFALDTRLHPPDFTRRR
jgi:RES domain-containing protein